MFPRPWVFGLALLLVGCKSEQPQKIELPGWSMSPIGEVTMTTSTTSPTRISTQQMASSEDLQNVELLRKAQKEAAQKLRIAPADLRKRVDAGTAVTMLDLRPKQEYDRSNIRLPGSIRTDAEQLAGSASWPRDRLTVAYCGTPNEEISARAVQKLRDLGFNDAFALEGGTTAWTAAGGQVELK